MIMMDQRIKKLKILLHLTDIHKYKIKKLIREIEQSEMDYYEKMKDFKKYDKTNDILILMKERDDLIQNSFKIVTKKKEF
jgi:hypothetical protein